MVELYCYPKCGTCKKAQAWLEGNDVAFEHIDIVQDTPNETQIKTWIETSGLPLRRFFNTSGMKYRELGLKDKVPQMTIAEAAAILATDGMLIKRPLIVAGERFLINGFKENEYEGVLLESWKKDV
jgi:arsenate reductase (glutaredoxin)